jgi:hypothetical protein
MYFDKVRIPSWGVHHCYSWFNSEPDGNETMQISTYYAYNCKLYDSVNYAPVYSAPSGGDMRISATLKLIPQVFNSLYLPDVLGTYFISPDTGYDVDEDKEKYKDKEIDNAIYYFSGFATK